MSAAQRLPGDSEAWTPMVRPSALAAGTGFEASSDRLRFFDDTACRVQEFLAGYRGPGATVGALEKCGAEFAFEITQAAAKC
jgi:hypothetical protein